MMIEFFILILLGYFGYSITNELKKLRHSIQRMRKGQNHLSTLLSELVGKTCRLTMEDGTVSPQPCEIIAVDEEWVTVHYLATTLPAKTKLIRTDSIEDVEIVEE